MPWVSQESFASGEIAPSLWGLVSSDQYRTGCMTLTNALLTATGSARKRFGTEDIVSTSGGHPAALFLYVQGARRFVIQYISQDDDAGDLNTSNRIVKVLDAETRQFISFGDGAAHGPFSATGDNTFYFHHFTATQLESVYAYQDGARIVFCHKDRPPLYMERAIGAPGVEQWRYGLVARDSPPTVFSNAVIDSISEISPTEIASAKGIFLPQDVNALWRIGGKEIGTGGSFIYSSWFLTTTWKSSTRMTGSRIHGTCGTNFADWTGPYKSGASFSATISSGSSVGFDVRDFSHTAGSPTVVSNQIGSPFAFVQGGNTTYWLIIANPSTTAFQGIRLGGAGLVTGAGTCGIYALGFDESRLLNRAYLNRHPVYPSDTTGSITIYCPEAFYLSPSYDNVPWLPESHETPFDGVYAGTVFLNGGAVALISSGNSSDSGGRVYSGIVTKTLEHHGPSMQWSIGWSVGTGFPRCGVAHDGRHWFGGFEAYTPSIVGSKVGKTDDFTVGANDDDGILFRLNDPTGGTPVWMESAGDLRIGTTTGEGVLSGTPITPSNVAWQRQTGHGGNNVRPLLVGSNVLFASANGVREQSFVYDRDTYEAPDISEIAKHLFPNHIAQMEYLNHPLQTVYIRDDEGRLVSLSYYRQNGVVGFSAMSQPVYPTSSGASSEESVIESIAAVRYGGSIGDDELWLVRRFKTGGQSGAGTTVRRIERMTPAFSMDQSWTDSSPSSTQIGTIPHLADLSQTAHKAQAILDGVYIGNFAVSAGGVLTYPTIGSTPTSGQAGRTIPFALTAYAQSPVDGQTGATQGRISGVKSAKVLIVTSKGGTVDGKRITQENVPAATVTSQITAVTAWRPVVGIGGHGIMTEIDIEHSVPYHFEVAGISFQVSYGA